MIGFVISTVIAIFIFYFADKIEPMIYDNLPIGSNFTEIFFIYFLPIFLGILFAIIFFKYDKSETLNKKIFNLIIFITSFISGFFLVKIAAIVSFFGDWWIIGIIALISFIFLIILILKILKKENSIN